MTIDQWIHYYLDSFCSRSSERRQSLCSSSLCSSAVSQACTAVPLDCWKNSRHQCTLTCRHKLSGKPRELMQRSLVRFECICPFHHSNACSQLAMTIIFVCHCVNRIVTDINETINQSCYLWSVRFPRTQRTTLQLHLLEYHRAFWIQSQTVSKMNGGMA